MIQFQLKLNIRFIMIYNDLKTYNNKVIDNLSYHNSIWIGYLYPESSYKLKTFDLTKIK